MSTPLLGSVQTMRVSVGAGVSRQAGPARGLRRYIQHTLLLVKAILLTDPSLQEHTFGLIFGFDNDSRFLLVLIDLNGDGVRRGRDAWMRARARFFRSIARDT